ncbi:major facilitator superfamily domain-containing protein, partial [Leucosporidium creatinivorum]
MYNRFSERRKSLIVAIVAFAALLAPFSSSAFLPSIPQICDDLHTTPTILNATVAIYIFVIGVVPLLWAPYAGLYGRRPIYLVSLPIYTLGSLGVALSNSLAALIITRIIQGAGSSAVLSVGAGTIGDLYPRHRRGAAMGYFYSGILIGPALAPAIAGVLSEYVRPLGSGWRAMQWLLFAMGVVACVLCAVCFPETSHKRGIEVLREERRERGEMEGGGWVRRVWRDTVFLNPVGSVLLLRQPHILAV